MKMRKTNFRLILPQNHFKQRAAMFGPFARAVGVQEKGDRGGTKSCFGPFGSYLVGIGSLFQPSVHSGNSLVRCVTVVVLETERKRSLQVEKKLQMKNEKIKCICK